MLTPKPHVVDLLLGLQLNIFQRYHTAGVELRDLKPDIAKRDELRKWLMMVVDVSGETPPAVLKDTSGG